MSQCHLIRADLDAYRDGMLDETRRQAVLCHLKDCPICNQTVEQANQLEQGIRAHSKNWVAPVGLWSRITSSVDSQATPGASRQFNRKKSLPWVAAAVLVMAVALVVVNVGRQEPQTSENAVATVLVNEFNTFVVSRRNLDYSNTQPVAIQQWFGNKVNFRLPLPANPPNLSLVGGRLCNMLDQRVASYMYQSGDAWVSLYIMKSMPESATSISQRQNHQKEIVLQGYGYIGWESQGLHYSLVGDVPVEQLRQISRSFNLIQFPTGAV